MFAAGQPDLAPAVLILAKGMASGFPMAAIGARAELMARWPTGSHGGTYGGNPIGCAAALATIDVLSEPGFMDHVNARGDQLRAGLRELAVTHPSIVDVRGPGLMVAAEFRDPDTLAPDAARSRIRHVGPILVREHAERLKFDQDKAKAWMGKGALPTDRVHRFFADAGLVQKIVRNNPNKATPKAKAQERLKAAAAAAGSAEAA